MHSSQTSCRIGATRLSYLVSPLTRPDLICGQPLSSDIHSAQTACKRLRKFTILLRLIFVNAIDFLPHGLSLINIASSLINLNDKKNHSIITRVVTLLSSFNRRGSDPTLYPCVVSRRLYRGHLSLAPLIDHHSSTGWLLTSTMTHNHDDQPYPFFLVSSSSLWANLRGFTDHVGFVGQITSPDFI